MTSRAASATSAALALVAALVVPAFAHEGSEAAEISVEPPSVTAGHTVVLAGTGLEPDSERQINLVGPDMIVTFATATTDADGMFSITLTIPAHLPAGAYTLQAIGDETLTTELAVTAAPGQSAAEPPNQARDVVTPRSRSWLDLAIIGAIVAVIAAVGLLLVAGAERVGRRPANHRNSEG